MVRMRTLQQTCVLYVALALVGCGGGDDDDDSEARKPDTGYGADQTVPTARSCTDFCARAADCATTLCNEDTKSTNYDVLEEPIAADCEIQCSEALLQSNLTDEQWQCLFESSCRQAFDYDVCHGQASYRCF